MPLLWLPAGLNDFDCDMELDGAAIIVEDADGGKEWDGADDARKSNDVFDRVGGGFVIIWTVILRLFRAWLISFAGSVRLTLLLLLLNEV